MEGCWRSIRGICGSGEDKPSKGDINGEGQPLIGKEEPKAPLSLWKFVFLAYFCVCGGPYGLEEAIGAGFPGLTLAFIVILPWVYSLPLALASAEMGSAMPDNDGFVLWVKSVWGPFWGYVSVIMNWFNYIADNALYPVLFMNYLSNIVGDDHWMHQPMYYYTLQFGLIFVIFLLNLAGIDLVGNASTLFAILILSPFLVLFLWSAIEGRINPHDLIMLPPVFTLDGVTRCLNVVVWGYTSYESLGSIVEELKEPKKNFVRSMLWLILLSIATYLMAFLGAVSLDTDYAKWDAGYFATVSGNLGGKPLKIVMIVAAMVSSVGTYNALLCTSAQELRALGKPDLLGSKLLRWKHPYFRTPWTAILINSLGASVFSLFSFGELVVMNNIIYGCILLMIFFTLVRMRYTHPDLERPYRISESNLLTALVVTPGCMISLYIIASSVKTSPIQLGIVAAMFVAASCSYFLLQYVRKKNLPKVKPDNTVVGYALNGEAPQHSDSDSD